MATLTQIIEHEINQAIANSPESVEQALERVSKYTIADVVNNDGKFGLELLEQQKASIAGMFPGGSDSVLIDAIATFTTALKDLLISNVICGVVGVPHKKLSVTPGQILGAVEELCDGDHQLTLCQIKTELGTLLVARYYCPTDNSAHLFPPVDVEQEEVEKTVVNKYSDGGLLFANVRAGLLHAYNAMFAFADGLSEEAVEVINDLSVTLFEELTTQTFLNKHGLKVEISPEQFLNHAHKLWNGTAEQMAADIEPALIEIIKKEFKDA